MAHIEKFQQHSLGHMLKHFERALDKNGEPIKYSNQNINLALTHLNYNLAPERENQYGFIMDRCKEVYCLKRKDVNLMCSCIVTAPKDLKLDEHESFFKATYDFLAARYGGKGAENVISAYVHMDEGSHHLHFAFVPVHYDKRKERWAVSAKEVVNRQDLKTLHPDLERYVGRALGHEVHIMTGELSNRPNLTLEQYKTLKDTQRNLLKAQDALSKTENEVAASERQLAALNVELEPKKAYIREYAQLQLAVNEDVREKTSLTGKKTVEMPIEKWNKVKMTYADKQAAQELYQRAEQMISDFQSTTHGKKHKQLVQDYEKTLESLKKALDTIDKYREANEHMRNEIQKVNDVFREHPEIAKPFFAALHEMEQAKQEPAQIDPEWDDPIR